MFLCANTHGGTNRWEIVRNASPMLTFEQSIGLKNGCEWLTLVWHFSGESTVLRLRPTKFGTKFKPRNTREALYPPSPTSKAALPKYPKTCQ
jgi:hypothetical protein